MANIVTRTFDRITGKQAQVNRIPTGTGIFSMAMPMGWGTQQYLDAYGQVGWLYACVSVISIAVGEAEWKLYKQNPDGELNEIAKHPLIDLLNYANPFQTRQEFFELSQCYDELGGQDYWYLARDKSGKIQELWNLEPGRVSVVPSRTEFIAGYVYQTADGQPMPIERKDIIHFKLPNPSNPYYGLGRVQTLMATLDAEKYRAQWNRNYFIEGASPSGTIEVPDSLTEDQYKRLVDSWNQGHRGVAKAHKIAILEGGAKFNEAKVGLKDMDFGNLAKLGRDTIIGSFGVPLHILGVEETTNRATAESAEYVFARWIIKPRLQRRKGKLNEVLVPQFGDNLVLDFVDPTPENKEFDLQMADKGYLGGWLTKNEARQIMGFDKDEVEGDLYRPVPTAGLWPGVDTTPKMLTSPKEKEAASPDRQANPDEPRWNEFVKRLTPRETDMAEWVRGFFNEQKKVTLEKFDAATLKPKGKKKVLVPDIFDSAYWAELAKQGAKPLLQAMLAEAGGDEAGKLGYSFDVHNPRVLEWLGIRTERFGKNINQTTADAISAQLRYGEEAGESAYQVAKRIESVFDQASESRAMTIARTEMVGSANRGAIEAYRQTGVVSGKRWISSQDEWTRHPPGDEQGTDPPRYFNHLIANGEIVGLDEPFVLTGEPMDHPGDINGSIGNCANCRCAVAAVLRGEERQVSRCPQCAKVLGYSVSGQVWCRRCKKWVELLPDKMAN